MSIRTEGHIAGYKNAYLFYQTWTIEKPKATLVVTHGIGEHSEWYSRFAEAMNQFGFDVFTFDLRGHGRSDGSRGVVDEFTDYCRDQLYFIDFVRSQRRHSPLFLISHSMGAMISARTLMDHGDMGFRGWVMSSPFFGVSIPVPPVKNILANTLVKFTPNLTLYNEIKSTLLTHDKKLLPQYESDPLRHQRISLRHFTELMSSVDVAMSKAEMIQLPVLMQLAGEEKVVSLPQSEVFFEKIGSKDKEKIVYDKMFHEIYNEVGRERVFNDLQRWLNAKINHT